MGRLDINSRYGMCDSCLSSQKGIVTSEQFFSWLPNILTLAGESAKPRTKRVYSMIVMFIGLSKGLGKHATEISQIEMTAFGAVRPCVASFSSTMPYLPKNITGIERTDSANHMGPLYRSDHYLHSVILHQAFPSAMDAQRCLQRWSLDSGLDYFNFICDHLPMLSDTISLEQKHPWRLLHQHSRLLLHVGTTELCHDSRHPLPSTSDNLEATNNGGQEARTGVFVHCRCLVRHTMTFL